jgi:hypothetical protein
LEVLILIFILISIRIFNVLGGFTHTIFYTTTILIHINILIHI